MLEQVKEAAKAAGKIITAVRREDVKARKNPHDIQHHADLASEEFLMKELKKIRDVPVMAEETSQEIEGDTFWCVDPVDGTVNFSKGRDEFCVSIAFIENGKVVLGVIYLPVPDITYSAEKDKGSFRDNERLSVSACSDLQEAVVGFNFTSVPANREKILNLLQKISLKITGIRTNGSAAISMCDLAEGKLDFYFYLGIHLWDYAAGSIILREAGGMITDFEGNDFAIDTKNVVVSNGVVHDEILDLLNI